MSDESNRATKKGPAIVMMTGPNTVNGGLQVASVALVLDRPLR